MSASRDRQARQAREVRRALRGRKATQATQAPQAPQARQDQRALQGLPDLEDYRDCRATRASRATLVMQVRGDYWDRGDIRTHKDFTTFHIAPSTVCLMALWATLQNSKYRLSSTPRQLSGLSTTTSTERIPHKTGPNPARWQLIGPLSIIIFCPILSPTPLYLSLVGPQLI